MTLARYLYCNYCHSEYSADASDYFMTANDHVFRCCKGANVMLLERTSRFEPEKVIQAFDVTKGDLRA